jgi:hypothetical protein
VLQACAKGAARDLSKRFQLFPARVCIAVDAVVVVKEQSGLIEKALRRIRRMNPVLITVT